jgi:hypothetical protein
MSGKSGQLLTPTFYDDCEGIISVNGHPVLTGVPAMFSGSIDELCQTLKVPRRLFENAENLLGVWFSFTKTAILDCYPLLKVTRNNNALVNNLIVLTNLNIQTDVARCTELRIDFNAETAEISLVGVM